MGLGPSTVLGVIYGVTSGAADPVLVYTKHERANQGDSISGATVGAGVLTGSPYTISNLTNGTEYEVQVQAMNTLTEFGEWSMSQFVTPVAPALPAIDAPSLPSLSSTTSTSVSFAWTAVTGAEKYGVQLRTGTGAWDGPHEVLTGTSYTAATLSPDTRYEFQVAAYGDGTTRRAAWGDWSPSLEADTAVDPTPQTCVTDLGSIEGASYGSADGEWTADCDSTHRTGKYAKFFTFEIPAEAEVTIELVGSEDPFLFLLEGSGTSGSILKKNDDSRDSTLGWTNSRIVRTLAAGTYTAEATTFNNNTTGTFNLAVDNELYEPTEPTNVDATGDDGEIVVAWNPPARNGGEPVTDYRVQYGTASNGSAWTPTGWQSTFLAHTKTITGLDNGITYYVAVQARNDIDPADGDGALSEPVTAVPVAQGAPGAPSNVELIVRDREIEVDWDPPQSDGGLSVSGHQFRYRVHGTQSWTETAEYTNGTRAGRSVSPTIPLADRVIDGLTNGTSYDVEVRVRNANGYGTWTEQQPVSATPAAATIAIESIEDASLGAGGSTVFSVRAENLSATVDYTIRLSTSATGGDAGVLKFNSCAPDAPDAIDFSIGTNASAVTIRGALTVFGCAAGGDDLTATLSGGTGTSPTATRAITVAETAFPTLMDPTASFAADGVTVDVEFTLPQDGLFYRLTLYRYVSDASRAVIARHSPVFGDTTHSFFIGRGPDSSRNYFVGLTACRDAYPDNRRCGERADSGYAPFSTAARIVLTQPDATTISAGSSTKFSARTSNLSPNQEYRLTLESSDGDIISMQPCGTPAVPRVEDIAMGRLGFSLEDVPANACDTGNDSAQVTAKLEVEGIEIATATGASITSAPVPVPTGLRANGDSAPSGAQFVVKWNSAGSEFDYEFKYGRACVTEIGGNKLTLAVCDTSDSQWHSPTLVSDNELILTGGGISDYVQLNGNYEMQVRSRLGGFVSDWSEHAFVRVTRLIPENPVLSSISFYGHQTDHDYFYRLCTNTFPAGTDTGAWTDYIVNGIAQWEQYVNWEIVSDGTTRNILTTTRDPNSNECGDYVTQNEASVDNPPLLNYDYSEVRFANRDEMAARCNATGDQPACAPLSSIEHYLLLIAQQPVGAIPEDVDILFDELKSDWAAIQSGDGTTCTRLRQIAAHEAGHAFGVRLDHTRMASSVMRSTTPTNHCRPQPFDILAFMAVYQSSDPE